MSTRNDAAASSSSSCVVGIKMMAKRTASSHCSSTHEHTLLTHVVGVGGALSSINICVETRSIDTQTQTRIHTKQGHRRITHLMDGDKHRHTHKLPTHRIVAATHIHYLSVSLYVLPSPPPTFLSCREKSESRHYRFNTDGD